MNNLSALLCSLVSHSLSLLFSFFSTYHQPSHFSSVLRFSLKLFFSLQIFFFAFFFIQIFFLLNSFSHQFNQQIKQRHLQIISFHFLNLTENIITHISIRLKPLLVLFNDRDDDEIVLCIVNVNL